jgi:hypothetical protein
VLRSDLSNRDRLLPRSRACFGADFQFGRALIDAFVLKDRRERLRGLIVNPRRRKQFVQGLAHFRWLDQRRIRALAPGAQNPEDIAKLLRLKGAAVICFLVSEDSALDRKQLPLLAALEEACIRNSASFLFSEQESNTR